MRILLVTSKYLPHIGGLEMAVKALNREFLNAGHETFIVTNRYPASLAQMETVDETSVERLFFTYGLPKLNLPQLLKYPLRLALIPRTLKRLKTRIREFAPDIVNLHFVGQPTPYVLRALKDTHIPLVVSLHGEDVETDIHQSAFRRFVFYSAVKKAEAVTSNSRYLLSRASEVCPAVEKKCTVVGNGYDLETSGEVGILPKGKYVITTSRLVHKKGLDILLDAWPRVRSIHPDLRLIIVGIGPELEVLQGKSLALGVADSVGFVGSVSRAQLIALLKNASVYCLPSRKEPFGISVLEAMACGLPVVASAVGGVPEVLGGGKLGYLVPPENEQALAEGILKALAEGPPIASDELSALTASQFSWASVASRYLSVFESCLSQSKIERA